ncbi:MAG: TetR/AcrR family transcriptional regulator, partial [Casimicrobium sp.]
MSAKFALPTVATLPATASARVRILTAGVEVLHSEGFSALTQQAVAEKAGVRQSHITYYFPTRLDLLRATAQFGAERMMDPISNAAISGDVTFEQFRELLLPDLSDRNWWRLMTALVNACSESDGIRNWIAQFDAQIRSRLHEGFKAFGIVISDLDIEFLHATYVGAISLDMQVLTDASQARAREIVGMGFDLIVTKSRHTEQLVSKINKAASRRTTLPPPRTPVSKTRTKASKLG